MRLKKLIHTAGITALVALAFGAQAAPPKAKPKTPAKPAVTKKTVQPAPKKPAPAKPKTTPTASDITVKFVPGESWPMFRANPQRTAFVPLTIPVKTLQKDWVWSKDAAAIVSSPVVANDTVYFGTRDANVGGSSRGALMAVSLSTGQTKWRYDVSRNEKTILTHTAKKQPATGAGTEALGWVESTPCVAGNYVYVTSRDGALHCVTTDGALKWRLRTGGLDTSSPNVINGTVYFGSAYPNKDFWAVDAVSGVVKWRTDSGIPGNPQRPGQFVYSSQAFLDGTVYAAANDGGFYGIDAATGKQKWRYETNGGIFFHTPAIADNLLIGAPGDYDTGVYALDRATGKLVWRYDPKIQQSYVSSPAYDGETVYAGIGTPDQMIVALEAKTGKEKWRYTTGFSTQQSYTSSPAVTNNVIFVGGAQRKMSDPPSGRLICLDKTNGKLLWEAALPQPVVSSPAVVRNYVVVGCMDGSVYAFKWGG